MARVGAGVAGLGARVRHRQPHPEHRRRQHQEHDRGTGHRQYRTPRDHAGPARRPRGTGPPPAQPRYPQPVDAPLGEPEQRRQERERGEHRQRDGQRHVHRHATQQRLAHEQQAEDADDDGTPGEEHGPAGGADRVRRGVGRLLAGGQALAEPGDDEQRVVHADAQPDHRAEDRGEARAGQHVVEQHHAGEPDADPEDRGHQRQDRRQYRAERDQQHDQRGGHPDPVGRAAARRLGDVHRTAAKGERDGVVGRRAYLPHQVQRLGRRHALVADRQRGLGERGTAVG